jgi:oligopeptide/dipeptide ABC transporter ATP-binding protein
MTQPGAAQPVAAQGATKSATTASGGIRLENIRVHYPLAQSFTDSIRGVPRPVVRAVDGVDLSIGRGEVVALVGESGSGKTTLARALVRLAPIASGRVLLDGRDVTALRGGDLREYRRRVQIVFQDPYESLDPRQTVLDVVAEPLDVHGLASGQKRRARVERALDDAGLTPASGFLGRYPHELSGGQRQRVAIAAAMVLEPEIVVADEPVSMLDVSLRVGILRVLLELRRTRNVGYLFITHDLSLAWLIADRIAVMYLGRIVEEGPAEEVIHNPQHPYTRALLSVAPSPDPSRRSQRRILVGETPDPARIPTGCRFYPRCPLQSERGRTEDPQLFAVAPGHTSACWLVENGERLPASLPGEPLRPVPPPAAEAIHATEAPPAMPEPEDVSPGTA